MKISKQKIQQLLNSKVSRAVDIIFAENKIDEVHEIYAGLLENKKNNTIALKEALENNYEKMLYCSDVLNQVKKYAGSIGEVTKQIQDQINEINGKTNKKQMRQQSQISAIENLMRSGKFYEAILKCNRKQQGSAADSYYLFYLKIQIVNKIERHMRIHHLNQSILSEYIKCLSEILFDKTNKGVKLKQNLDWTKDFKQKSLIKLISAKTSTLQIIQSEAESRQFICEIIFEFKLHTLRSKFKNKYNAHSFQQYFEELGTILKISKNIKGEDNNLSKIFHKSVPQIKSQLASIFIQTKSTGQIIFKCDLYDDLLKNQNFETVVEKFHQQISQQGIEIDHPLKFVRELWHDYFVNLIDHSLNQTNPLSRIASLKQNSLNLEAIPQELAIYLYDYSIEQSLHIITEYEDKTKLFEKNILPIISRCNAQELQKLKETLRLKLQEIAKNCLKFIQTNILAQIATLSFRKYFLLRILCSMLQNQVNQISIAHRLQVSPNILTQIYNDLSVDKFWQCFVKNSFGEVELNQSIINFDSFFIGYVQGVNQKLKLLIFQIIKEISMKILIHISENAKGRQKQSIDHTIQSLKQKKQKVTILQTIVTPYLASKIFQCQMKPIAIQKIYFTNNFITKESKKIVKVEQVADTDDFQIGQKDQKDQYAKVNVNIGKSIMNLGNNIFTGLMTKKK